jgi:4a-hydroxytetrahydrobiopterin dehydratase
LGAISVTIRDLLSSDEVQAELASLSPDWTLAGNELHRSVKFPTFLAAVQFVSEMAPAAEQLDHHPDITLSWRNVGIALSTHSAGGLTGLDFELARQLDSIIDRLAG